MGDSTPLPNPAAIARAELFTREQFVYEGETLEDALAPGSARRRALDAALTEIEAGNNQPSIAWRRSFSLLLGLERLLSEEEPHLADGTVLSAHQVDALSGTLTALLAEAQRNGTGANGNGGARPRRLGQRRCRPTAPLGAGEARVLGDPRRGGLRARERRRGSRRRRGGRGAAGLAGRRGRARRGRPARRAARGPQRRPPVLVRARHRRRQDGRRARVRRGLAHRRRADPHPPPQPRRPVQRRAARPRLPRPDPRAAARRPGRRQRPGDGRDLPVVRSQRGQDLRRLHDRDLRRGAHRARREDLGRDPRLVGPDLHRHDGHRRADRPARHRPVPDPDLALRPRAGRAARRDRAAALHPDPARSGRADDRQGAAAPRRGRHRVRPGDAGRAARPDAVQRRGRRPLQDALQRDPRRRLRRRRAPRLQRRAGVPGRSG